MDRAGASRSSARREDSGFGAGRTGGIEDLCGQARAIRWRRYRARDLWNLSHVRLGEGTAAGRRALGDAPVVAAAVSICVSGADPLCSAGNLERIIASISAE